MPPADCREIFEKLWNSWMESCQRTSAARSSGNIAGCPPCIEFVASLKQSIELCTSTGGDGGRPAGYRRAERLEAAYRKMLEGRQKA